MKNLFPLIDGLEPSWADISVSISPSPIMMGASIPGGLPIAGNLFETKDLFAVNTGRTLAVEKTSGISGGRTRRMTTGKADETAGLTFYRTGFESYLEKLIVVAPDRSGQAAISLVKFDIDVKFRPPGSLKIYNRIIRGARHAGDTHNSQEGPEASKVEVTLVCHQIVDIVNGREVVLV